MCGKFSQMFSWSELHALLNEFGEGGDGTARPDSNDKEETLTPMREARVIRLNAAGKREIVGMRWGWPDRWSAVPQFDRPKHMHAKGETVDTLRTFKDSFARRRGILPVKTFNVGEEVGKRVVQHVLTPRDGKPLGIAVIWDEVLNRDGVLIPAFVMVTTEPNSLIATVTDRMPAILPLDKWGLWLGETFAPLPEIKAALVPYAGQLEMELQAKGAPKGRGGTYPTQQPLM